MRRLNFRGYEALLGAEHCRSVHPERWMLPEPQYACDKCLNWGRITAVTLGAYVPAPEPREDVASLIERSSLGTPAAKAARESVSDEQVARVVARAKELDREAEITEVLAEHRVQAFRWGDGNGPSFGWKCSCGDQLGGPYPWPAGHKDGRVATRAEAARLGDLHLAEALAPVLAERERAAVEGARDESAVAEVGLTEAEWTRLRHAAGNRGDLGPIAEEVERILGERVQAAAEEALREAAADLLARSRDIREAYRKHNAGRDLSKRQPIRPDLNNWADATEANGHALNRRADRRAER